MSIKTLKILATMEQRLRLSATQDKALEFNQHTK